MVTDGDCVYSEHSVMSRIVEECIESLCCIPETSITLYVDYMSIKNFFSIQNLKKLRSGKREELLGSVLLFTIILEAADNEIR